jgi:hypothetical protein
VFATGHCFSVLGLLRETVQQKVCTIQAEHSAGSPFEAHKIPQQ